MKYFELTKEEGKLLREIEEGKLVRVKNLRQAKEGIALAAKNTLDKTRNINIRLSERVLSRLKAKAIEAGLPYQTLAASILHRFTTSTE